MNKTGIHHRDTEDTEIGSFRQEVTEETENYQIAVFASVPGVLLCFLLLGRSLSVSSVSLW